MADKSSGEEDELRRWFRLNGLEAPNPSGHFDAHRWRARTPVPLPARSQFIAAVVAFIVVLGAGAVWLHGGGNRWRRSAQWGNSGGWSMRNPSGESSGGTVSAIGQST
jgi:hypothetical protein